MAGDRDRQRLALPREPGGNRRGVLAAHGARRLRVGDVAQAREALEARGVEFDEEIRDTGVCHMAFFKDSEGNRLMLHHRYAP